MQTPLGGQPLQAVSPQGEPEVGCNGQHPKSTLQEAQAPGPAHSQGMEQVDRCRPGPEPRVTKHQAGGRALPAYPDALGHHTHCG